MPRKPAMTPEQLEAYLGKLQSAGVQSFEGLGLKVTFSPPVNQAAGVDPDHPDVPLTDEERRKLEHQEAMVNEDWSSQG